MSALRPAPAWLASFQAQFGDALRAPLRPDGGALRPAPAAYPPSLCQGVTARGAAAGGNAGGAAGLAVYNRQYWFRLFQTLQGELPLTARLLGLWTFNQVAQAFLLAHPPQHADLRRAADGFADALITALNAPAAPTDEGGAATPAATAAPRASRTPTEASIAAALAAPPAPTPSALPRAALAQAARLDEAWRTLWAAPEQPAWRPGADDARRFERLRLRRSEAAALVSEGWPLLELRQALSADDGEGAVPLPQAHAGERHWALCRADGGVLRWPLEPAQARLFALLALHPVGRALGLLEAETPASERGRLTERVQAWLAQSVRVGFWAGASEEAGAATAW